MKKLYVTAEIKIHPHHIEEATNILNTLACNSIAEAGCNIYQILKSTADDYTFTTFELWNSKEAEHLHWEKEHKSLT